jgi:hypothetical protein
MLIPPKLSTGGSPPPPAHIGGSEDMGDGGGTRTKYGWNERTQCALSGCE